jgi:hypothetical protein
MKDDAKSGRGEVFQPKVEISPDTFLQPHSFFVLIHYLIVRGVGFAPKFNSKIYPEHVIEFVIKASNRRQDRGVKILSFRRLNYFIASRLLVLVYCMLGISYLLVF